MPEAMAPTMSVDETLHRLFNTPEGRADPYPRYRELQGARPVFRSEHDGLWYTCRHELCHQLPVVDGQTVGIEYADEQARLAAEFMRAVIDAEAASTVGAR